MLFQQARESLPRKSQFTRTCAGSFLKRTGRFLFTFGKLSGKFGSLKSPNVLPGCVKLTKPSWRTFTVLVRILSFGCNWWARFGHDPEDRYRYTRRAAYYNSTGVRCGNK